MDGSTLNRAAGWAGGSFPGLDHDEGPAARGRLFLTQWHDGLVTVKMLTLFLLLLLALPALAGEVLSSAATQRLVYVASGAKEDFAVLDWTMNLAMNRRHHQVRLGMTPDPHVAIIDLAALSQDAKDFRELADTWERLALLESNYLGAVIKQKDGTIKRLPSANAMLGPMVSQLITLRVTNVPIIESRQLLREMLSTVDGGLYYQFRGIGKTQDEFLRKFSGTTEREVAKLRSDAKAAQLVSEVTGKPRGVLLYHGIGGHVARNQGLVAITFDSKDGNRDPDFDPFRNAVDQKADATEIILELATGFHAFALFDGKGNRQDSAPDDVVKDHKVPPPHTARLQGAISCIRCHGPQDGWQPVKNDLLDFKRGLFGDAGRSSDPDRVFGLLAEQLDQPLQLGRDHYLKAVVYLTSQYALDMDAKQIAARLSETWDEFVYQPIDQAKAVAEVGLILRREMAEGTTLESLLIPNPADASGFSFVDPYVSALTSGKSIKRREWESISPDVIANIRPEPK